VGLLTVGIVAIGNLANDHLGARPGDAGGVAEGSREEGVGANVILDSRQQARRPLPAGCAGRTLHFHQFRSLVKPPFQNEAYQRTREIRPNATFRASAASNRV